MDDTPLIWSSLLQRGTTQSPVTGSLGVIALQNRSNSSRKEIAPKETVDDKIYICKILKTVPSKASKLPIY